MIVITLTILFSGCVGDQRHKLVISTTDQKMVLLDKGEAIAIYPVSTSKFGIGDRCGSCATPLGHFCIEKKIGQGVPLGTVFKNRKPTGEILRPNAPGRDPIVTRILWLKGKESQNKNAFARYIYIHGTPEEALLGQPKSFGCIRMSSSGVAQLYDIVGTGAKVEIIDRPL
ncbi:MAG TPA: L,D-transpeptidase [Chthoniobacterales bacterium]|nr:L,D-transpeptidase [Chthoniobacterales bacterium]